MTRNESTEEYHKGPNHYFLQDAAKRARDYASGYNVKEDRGYYYIGVRIQRGTISFAFDKNGESPPKKVRGRTFQMVLDRLERTLGPKRATLRA